MTALKRRSRAVVPLVVALTMSMFVGGLTVYADDLSVPEGVATGSTPTSFVVTEDMLHNDVVVSIPSELILRYDADRNVLTKEDYVSASGSLRRNKHLEVSVPSTIMYEHVSASSVTVNGVLSFGRPSGGIQEEQWNSNEVLNSDKREISSTVDADDLEYAGSYKATIRYQISVKDN